MASKSIPETQSPASVSASSLIDRHSRRGSLASVSSRSQIDKEALSQALDKIHTSASRSDTLTTFDEFASPPPPSGNDTKSIAGELVQGGLSGLYTRIRASVGAARDAVAGPASSGGNDSADDSSISSFKARTTLKSTKSPAGTAISSPVVVSTPSSRLQSPLVATFPESQIPIPKPPDSTAASHGSKVPSATPKSPRGAGQTVKEGVASIADALSSKLLKDQTQLPQGLGNATRLRGGSVVEQNVKSPELKPSGNRGVVPNNLAGLSRTPEQGPLRLDRVITDRKDLLTQVSLRDDESASLQIDDESDTTEDDLVVVSPNNPSTAPDANATLKQPRPDDSRASIQTLNSKRSHSQSTTHTIRRDAAARPQVNNRGDQQLDSQGKGRSAEGSSTGSVPTPHRPPLLHVSQGHLPGYRPSRASSSDDMSSLATVAAVRHPTFEAVEEYPLSNSGKKSGDFASQGPFTHFKRKILGKEFWMKDENAKYCFNCGDAFSTFRRKHHCRTCGQIFDSKCTNLVSGKLFGQSRNLLVCKPCEAIIYGNDDDSSVYTEDADLNSTYQQEKSQATGMDSNHTPQQSAPLEPSPPSVDNDYTNIGTPTMGIPTSRKPGEKKRRSAVIEVDNQPMLARPSSSRSLRSLSGRPRSSSHKRHHSRHQHMRSLKSSHDDRAPFHRNENDESNRRLNLPAFHHDSIIDPDLVPFMSDEGSSEDEQLNIFAALSGDSQVAKNSDSDRSGLSGLFAAIKKGKSRTGEKSVGAIAVYPARDGDTGSVMSRNLSRHPRRRNLSVSSLAHVRASPRRSKSNSLLKSFGAGLAGITGSSFAQSHGYIVPNAGGSRMTRSASMRGKNTPVVELNRASLQHVKRLLKQMLQDAVIPDIRSWEKALIPILLQCTDDVNPDVQRKDDIDIRHYIKLKKIPGGKPGDTSYVSGVVFTKNVALKSMPRCIRHPRIVIVTFAIEYARHQQHFMSLEPVIAQEREYLRNLVGRIAALKPTLLLVQRNVAGLALEFLAEADITVVYNVKPSVLNAVARCTQTRMISSVDKLAIDPSQLGRCGSFDVKTYVHNRRKKTYLYLSGCQKDLGCTIVLRGAEIEILRKLKRITEFMCFVVYNLKLETCLMRDEFVSIPPTSSLFPSSLRKHGQREKCLPNEPILNGPSADQEESKPRDQFSRIDSITQSKDINTASGIDKQPSAKGSPNDPKSGVEEAPLPDGIPMASLSGDMVEKHKTRILSASPFVKFMPPYLLIQAREQECRLAHFERLRDQYTAVDETLNDEAEQFELVRPEMVHTMVEKASKQVRDFLHAVHNAEYEKALHNYLTQKRQWETFLATNGNIFDPFNHQRIAILYSVVNSITSIPCEGPEIVALSFYNEHDLEDGFAADCTLGQYVEDLCYGANDPCDGNGCHRKMFDHHRQYVHGDSQISVIGQKRPSRIKGLENQVLMWSQCRKCGQETQVIPMSENTWKYSFAKYLELTFWSAELHPRADICSHDIHKDHVRYFGFNNVALRIQYDPIHLHEVIVPRPTITWKVDSDLHIKNEQFKKIEERLDRFMASVRARLKSIHVESVVPEKSEACKVELDKLSKRVNEEHEFLRRKLQNKYMQSRYYEIIPLNRAVRAIQEKALAWDDTFADFEQTFFPSEKDIKRLAALQIKKLFLDRDESSTSITSIDESQEASSSGTTTPTEKDDILPLTPKPSHISAEKAHDVMTSVIKDDRLAGEEQLQMNEKQADDQGLDQTRQHQPIIPAAERKEVQHLDLALPSERPNPAKPAGQLEQIKKSPTTPLPTPQAEPQVNATGLRPSSSEQLHALVGSRLTAAIPHPHVGDTPPESRIPRPVDSMRRDGITRPSFNRTQSQPPLHGRRDTGASSASSSGASTVASTVKTESSRPSPSESARALERRIAERLGMGSFKPAKSLGHSMIPRSIPSKRYESKVSSLARHFEQLSKEFENARLRERKQRAERSRQARAYPLASFKPIVEVYQDAHKAIQEPEVTEEEPQTTSTGRASTETSTLGDSSFTETTTEPTTGTQSPVDLRPEVPTLSSTQESVAEGLQTPDRASEADGESSDVETTGPDDIELPIESLIGGSQVLSPSESQLDISLEFPKHEKTSLIKFLTSFWSERSSSGWAPLDYPFSQIEHVWEDSDIIVREDEPSSVIALALSCSHYQTKLKAFRDTPEDGSKPEDEDASIERNLLHQSNTNIRYAFTNRGVRAQCKIFYAQSFDALRRKCGAADRFVESLSRCLKWDSKGGKTKSIFLKTLDDRFVLKSLSPVEVNAFFKFAPNYFAFTHENLFKGLPSVMAKMFGLFQVQIKNPASGRDFDFFMLVMENLFYDREDLRRFDLKGSMRNRKIEITGEVGEVLQDENLVDIIFEKPIFVREHTKKVLKTSVWNDTLFLSKQNVMDYSLMAGFDDVKKEIVVGIIDCIRTYTWDKKLETWFKDRGKNKPTVTSPKDYRLRFRIAMSRYILQAPNCWHQFPIPQMRGPPPRAELKIEGEDALAGANAEVATITADRD